MECKLSESFVYIKILHIVQNILKLSLYILTFQMNAIKGLEGKDTVFFFLSSKQKLKSLTSLSLMSLKN